MVGFELCVIAHLSIPCYFGNEMKIKHERLTGCIYNCGWHLKSKRYRKIVMIFVEMVKHKLEFLVGNWIVLDLNLFVEVSQSIRLIVYINFVLFSYQDYEFRLSIVHRFGISQLNI